MTKPIPAGTMGELPPVPIVGGPFDGACAAITIVLPFLGGGIAVSVWVKDGHCYELRRDRSAWVYTGVAKEAKR